MKKFITPLAFTLFFLIFMPSVYAATEALTIESNYTFDSVPDGTVVLHDFIIKNDKDIVLKITGVKPG